MSDETRSAIILCGATPCAFVHTRNRISKAVNIQMTKIMELAHEMINGPQVAAYRLVEIARLTHDDGSRLLSCDSPAPVNCTSFFRP